MFNEIFVSSFIGLLVSTFLSYYMFQGRQPASSLILMFSGFIGGWIGGMLWMFIMGGLVYNVFMAIPAVVISSVLSLMVLSLLDIRVRSHSRLSLHIASYSLITGVMIMLLIAVFASALIPMDTGYSVDAVQETATLYRNTGRLTAWPEEEGFIMITTEIVAVDFPVIAANPAPGDYVKFAVQFDVSDENWEQPYVKLLVVDDSNGNGVYDASDEIWDNNDWKVCIGDSGDDGNWRSNIVYSTADQQQVHYYVNSGTIVMPVFHCASGQFTIWKDDSNIQCSNTPEKYTSPRDQISWQISGQTLTQKDTITGFNAIPVGSSSKLYGKIYCSSLHTGKNFLVITAFDKRYQTDPFAGSTPISTNVKSFTIGNNTDGGGTTDNTIWYIAGGGVGVIVLASVLRRRKPVYYYPAPPPQYPPKY